MNDTLTGDPLLTVPILTGQSNESSSYDAPSLCYEVHGRANAYFNLISDECTSVNAYYEKVQSNSSNIDLNVVTQIGVRAIGVNGTCTNIKVGLDGCQVSINGALITNTTNVVMDGLMECQWFESAYCSFQLCGHYAGDVGVLYQWSSGGPSHLGVLLCQLHPICGHAWTEPQ